MVTLLIQLIIGNLCTAKQIMYNNARVFTTLSSCLTTLVTASAINDVE